MALAGCVSDVTTPERTLWEAELVGTELHAQVSGSAAAISRGASTEAGITVHDLGEGVYDWRLREGRCGDPGMALGPDGAFESLVVDDLSGSMASAEALTSNPMRDGRSYLAEVSERDTGERVACGEFTQI